LTVISLINTATPEFLLHLQRGVANLPAFAVTTARNMPAISCKVGDKESNIVTLYSVGEISAEYI
jgi:hypothetical protein